jgi:hypothetical protein
VDASEKAVAGLEGLMAAAGDEAVRRIVVEGEITGVPSFRLAPGRHLVGAAKGAALVFADGAEGVEISRDNEVAHIRLQVDPGLRAIFNDTEVDGLGLVRLADVSTVGQVQILARDRVRGGHVEVDGLDVVEADVRERNDQPELLGVGVLQGAFTLWTLQTDDDVVLTARLKGVSAGREAAPVRGSGVFVAGAGESGGTLEVGELETGPIFTDGGLVEGTHDAISGGVFVVHGCHVRDVRNRGPVTTYGVNDMALDNWGIVDSWAAEAPVTTYGRSGVGFVNFGTLASLRIDAPVETHGIGARGFNVYKGSAIEAAEFDRITTHADAAIGIQIGQPLGRLIVRRGIHTHGGTGDALVKGVITQLSAHALSVLEGGNIGEVVVDGALTSDGAGVNTVDVEGEIGAMKVAGGIHARGAGCDAIHVDGGTLGLYETEVSSIDGAGIRLARATLTEMRDVTVRGAGGDVVVDGDSTLITKSGFADPSMIDNNQFTITGPGVLRSASPP